MTTFTTDKSIFTKSSVNNNNILVGTNVMPMKGQTSSSGGTFSLMRQIYQKTTTKEKEPNHDNTHKGKQTTVYQDNSLYLLKKKGLAMGKQSYSSPLSFNSNLTQDVKSAQKRVRSSGAIAPPKKGHVS